VHSGRCLGAIVKTHIQFQSEEIPSTRGVRVCCILPLLVGPSRRLGSLTAANWVFCDFYVAYSHG